MHAVVKLIQKFKDRDNQRKLKGYQNQLLSDPNAVKCYRWFKAVGSGEMPEWR